MKIAAVCPHGRLEKLAPGLWQVTGTMPGNPLPRNMVVYRLADGGLLLHSAVALDEPGMAALAELGAPRVLVVPNRFHRRDAAFFRQKFPDLTVTSPAAAMGAVARAVPVNGAAEELLPPLGVVCHHPAGTKPGELVYELPLHPGRALVTSDLLFNLDALPGLKGWVLGKLGSTGFFGVTGIGRLMMVRQAAELRQWLETMAGLPDLVAVCPGHGKPVLADCAAQLRQAAARIR